MKTFNITGFLLLPALVMSSPAAKAQNSDSRYIEVTVSDTLNIMPDVVEYTLTLRQAYDYPAYETEDYSTTSPDYMAEIKKREEEMKLKMKMTEKRMTELLAKEKITYTRAENANNISLITYPEETGTTPAVKPFVIRFNSFDQMNRFREKIPEDLKYEGNLTNLVCTRYAELEEKLLEKLMVKAKKQADKLAAISHVKLGNMVQFSDNTSNDIVEGIEQLITGFMNKYEREKYFDLFRNMNISKTVRVRYAIE